MSAGQQETEIDMMKRHTAIATAAAIAAFTLTACGPTFRTDEAYDITPPGYEQQIRADFNTAIRYPYDMRVTCRTPDGLFTFTTTYANVRHIPGLKCGATPESV
jgi:hypothetical protein